MATERSDPASADPAATEHVLDGETIEGLEALAEDGDDLLAELIGLFLADGARGLEEVKAAFAKSDVVTLAKVTHKLKSSSGYLGATRVAKAALEIESLSKRGTSPSAELVDTLEREMHAAFDALRKLRPQA